MPVNPTWAASLEKQLRETQEALRRRDAAEVALWSSARCEAVAGETRLEIPFWGRPYFVTWSDLTVRDKAGQPCPAHFAGLILQHLLLADGAPVENTWVSLRNLPHGAFYEQAFQSYSGNLLVKSFRGDVEAFRRRSRTWWRTSRDGRRGVPLLGVSTIASRRGVLVRRRRVPRLRAGPIRQFRQPLSPPRDSGPPGRHAVRAAG